MKHPLLPVALCYGGGILLAEFCQPPLPIAFSAAFALLGLSLLWSRARPHLLWPIIVLTGWTNLVYRTAVVSPHDLRPVLGDSATFVTVRGTLCETPDRRVFERDGREVSLTRAQVQIASMLRNTDWQPAMGRIAVTTPAIVGGEFFAGRMVQISGVLAPPPLPVAEGLFDYRTYLRRQGIDYQLKAGSASDWRLLSTAAARPPLSDRFRTWAQAALARGLPQEDESLRLERALTLGDKTVLTDEVSEPFVRAATYHIFAVDGLRMAILFGIFFTLFRTLRLPRPLCGLLLIPLIWFYTALTGWPASAIRATVMLTIVILGWALKRPSDLVNSLFAAALIILICDPQQLFQAGFQLSFLVVLCIVLVVPAIDKFSRRLLQSDPLLPEELRPRWQQILDTPARFFLALLSTSFAAWIGSIPLVACYFHIVTPVSTPANVIAVPLCALVLASDIISLSLAGWFPTGAELFNHAGWFLMECIRTTSHWFANWPGAYYYVAPPALFTAGLYYLILLTVLTGWLFKPRWRAGKVLGLGLLSLLWCVQWQHEHSATLLTILPLNGGHAVFVDGPGRENDWLIDCGNTNAVDFVVKPFLRAHGVNRLPRLALTHGDLRHVGGAGQVGELFKVSEVCTSPVSSRSATYRSVLAGFKRTARHRQIMNRGDQAGGWIVLHPDADDRFPQADDNSLVLLGVIHGTRVLLLSDLGRPGQITLIARTRDLRADIVVSGLPAKGEALSNGLLETIRPKLIIVADSEFPVTERASSALRDRLAAKGIPVVYMRTAGAVTLTVNESGWTFRTMNGQKGGFPKHQEANTELRAQSPNQSSR